MQLTGFSDPVYAEAVVTIQQFDVVLEVLIVNQTTTTHQNLTIDFATLGDLKLVERPAPHTIGPHGFHHITATIKVSSTETGVIFGNATFDKEGASDASVNIVLSDIQYVPPPLLSDEELTNSIDVLDWIKPHRVNEAQFRSMWTEFEWENKVAVSAQSSDLRGYLNHLKDSTHMEILTPENALSGDCSYLSANLSAISSFGEMALANCSIELTDDGTITGHIRIRSKTQGIVSCFLSHAASSDL